MREHHKKNQELLESERIAVNELELELEALTAQEINKKKEVDILESQKEKQLLHLQALHAKTIELDVVSSASMKKHIEEQKQCEYEDQLKRQLQELSNQNKSLEKEVQDMTEKASSLDIQLEQDRQLLDQIEKEVIQAEAQRDELVEKVDATRSCHTPRPDWDAIIEEIPEIVSNTYQWDEVEGYDEEEEAEVDDAMEITSEEFDQGTTSKTGGVRKKIITSRLIKEMLHWIESLQKHCGVDLHLSNLWRDVEEARIELNILHQQLDHAMRQHPKSPSSSLIKHNVEATQAHSRRPIIKPERILTLGNSAEVPKFLQHTGRVTKRHITKKELKIIIRNVWNEKKRLQERSGMDLRLEDILYEKLKQKHGFQPVIAEWGYNILIALNMYVSDSEVELFLLCLTGAISEQVYDDQENMINSCQEILMKLCHAYQNESFLKEKKIRLVCLFIYKGIVPFTIL
jgi:hypothetical protein